MPQAQTLEPGLYLVATPIGNARDITLRALDILASADVIAAEDTRSARKLLNIHGVALGGRPLVAYHDHSRPEARARLLEQIAQGRSVAYVSEAGMPMVADPGYALARDAEGAGHLVTVAPGASAPLAALSVSGLPTDRFVFAGFAPQRAGPRRVWIDEVAALPATLVFFESPRRVQQTLTDFVQAGHGARQASLCRELTKKFEEVRRGTVAELLQSVTEEPVRGEVVIVMERGAPGPPGEAGVEKMEEALREALENLPLKEAARQVADRFGLTRREVYQAGLALEGKR